MAAKGRKGAVVRKIDFGERRDAWLRHHRSLALDSLHQMLMRPVASSLTWLVIAIAISLPALMYLFLLNVNQFTSPLEDGVQLSIYLNERIDENQGRQLAADLQQRPEIRIADYVSSDDGLIAFSTYSGLGNIIESLDTNPLPAVVRILPSEETSAAVESLELMLQQLPEVSDVQLDLEWVQRINQLSLMAERLVLFLSLLFSLAVLLVVGNTVRLAIESRREEILVVKMVGGTNAFVRRPFLYMGFWFGLAGGLFAWLLISVCFFLLKDPAQALFLSLGSQNTLIDLGAGGVILLLTLSVLVSLFGSVLAVGRHIRAIEPS